MKNPEQMARIELMARIEQTARIAHAALDAALVAHAVPIDHLPIDHPLALAFTDAKLSLAKLVSVAGTTLARFKR